MLILISMRRVEAWSGLTLRMAYPVLTVDPKTGRSPRLFVSFDVAAEDGKADLARLETAAGLFSIGEQVQRPFTIEMLTFDSV